MDGADEGSSLLGHLLEGHHHVLCHLAVQATGRLLREVLTSALGQRAPESDAVARGSTPRTSTKTTEGLTRSSSAIDTRFRSPPLIPRLSTSPIRRSAQPRRESSDMVLTTRLLFSSSPRPMGRRSRAAKVRVSRGVKEGRRVSS